MDHMSSKPRTFGLLAVIALFIGGVFALLGPTASRLIADPPSEGPTAVLGFHEDGIQFEYPATWSIYHFRSICLVEGCSFVVLGRPPVPAVCQTSEDDMNCAGQRPLEPGGIRLEIANIGNLTGGLGNAGFFMSTDGAKVTRVTVGGMPAAEVVRDPVRVELLRADVDVGWLITRPEGIETQQAITVNVVARAPGASRAVAEVRALIDSLRFDPSPNPVAP